MLQALEAFLQVVEEEDFVEAHEVLEETWRAWKNNPQTRQESYILKGLINGATALALVRLGREASAHKVWETYEKYRPLIETTPSPLTLDYRRACALLEAKYSEVFSAKNPH
jgi:hypothetical protein